MHGQSFLCVRLLGPSYGMWAAVIKQMPQQVRVWLIQAVCGSFAQEAHPNESELGLGTTGVMLLPSRPNKSTLKLQSCRAVHENFRPSQNLCFHSNCIHSNVLGTSFDVRHHVHRDWLGCRESSIDHQGSQSITRTGFETGQLPWDQNAFPPLPQ